jgi:hypothetical protein
MRGEFLSLVASSLLKTIANYNPASVRWPAVEDNHGRSFRSSGNDLKQHLSGGLRHRHLRHLVDDDQFVFRPPLGDPIEFTVFLASISSFTISAAVVKRTRFLCRHASTASPVAK